jgi:hypothetical protein
MELDHAKISKAFNWTIKYMLALQRGSTVNVNDVPVRDKSLLVEMVKAYIDCYHDAEFNEDYTVIKKLSKWNTNK